MLRLAQMAAFPLRDGIYFLANAAFFVLRAHAA